MSSNPTPSQIADQIINLLGGNGLSTNQSRALVIELLDKWKTEEEARLRYQLIGIKSTACCEKRVALAKQALANPHA
jgi:hypothetical protein